jgi:hypothetical protein
MQALYKVHCHLSHIPIAMLHRTLGTLPCVLYPQSPSRHSYITEGAGRKEPVKSGSYWPWADTVRPSSAAARVPGRRGYLSWVGGTSSRLPDLLIGSMMTLATPPVSYPRDRHLPAFETTLSVRKRNALPWTIFEHCAL